MKFLTIIEKFDALGERERLAVLFLSIITIVIIFAEFLILPLNQKYSDLDGNVTSILTQNQQLKNQLLILKANKKNEISPKEKQQQKLNLLKEQITNLNIRLKENMRGLIGPKEMSQILESVLSKTVGLKLQSIESLPSKPLSSISTKEGEKLDNFGIYHHGMRMKLTGSYLATLKYLEALDKLPWDFYWDDLELNVDKYPNSSIDITVHTLSFHKDWIGV